MFFFHQNQLSGKKISEMCHTVWKSYKQSTPRDKELCVRVHSHLIQNTFERIELHIYLIRVSNSLDPDQATHFVRPDLGLNCFQSLSADDIK